MNSFANRSQMRDFYHLLLLFVDLRPVESQTSMLADIEPWWLFPPQAYRTAPAMIFRADLSDQWQAIGDDYVGTSSPQSTILELELDRVFCSGAWLATVILACAASEVYLHAKDQKREAKFLSEYKLREDWLWLKKRRNQLVHINNSLSYADYMHAPKTLEDEAKRAVQIALKVILLGTREELDDSVKRTET